MIDEAHDDVGESKAVVLWKPTDWTIAKEVANAMSGWLFRGQSDAEWKLETNLERGADGSGYDRDDLYLYEKEAVEDFQRQAHQYLTHLPDAKGKLEWLALIQHHGGATRLLDVTQSFYVAAYFAMDGAKSDAAVWAIHRSVLRQSIVPDKTLDGKGPAGYSNAERRLVEYFLGVPGVELGVMHVKPWWLSERMVAQQGSFLVPEALRSSFGQNLAKTLGIPAKEIAAPAIVKSDDRMRTEVNSPNASPKAVKIVLPKTIHNTIRLELPKMNITTATLYPGLDGYIRSLRYPFTFSNWREDLEE
jgi:hypothetical protein